MIDTPMSISATGTRRCSRCKHWGTQPDARDTDRWRMCVVRPKAMANADHCCTAFALSGRKISLAAEDNPCNDERILV